MPWRFTSHGYRLYFTPRQDFLEVEHRKECLSSFFFEIASLATVKSRWLSMMLSFRFTFLYKNGDQKKRDSPSSSMCCNTLRKTPFLSEKEILEREYLLESNRVKNKALPARQNLYHSSAKIETFLNLPLQ